MLEVILCVKIKRIPDGFAAQYAKEKREPKFTKTRFWSIFPCIVQNAGEKSKLM